MNSITNLLTDAAFHSTMAKPMKPPPDDDDGETCDIWKYIAAIPKADLAGFSIANSDVESVYRTGDRKYDHVMIPTDNRNTYLVIVVDVTSNCVFGHHLLDLNKKYGLD